MKHSPLFSLFTSLASAACGGEALDTERTASPASPACTYPMIATFGVADNFNLASPDPIPFNPAHPAFVAFLNGQGIPTANLKTFDSTTSNRHMVATLIHGLAACFPTARALELCFRARAHSDIPGNDRAFVYDTDFVNGTFPVLDSAFLAPDLISAWTIGQVADLCFDLTAQMNSGAVGNMLQFRVQDDTAVDVITLRLD